MFGEYDRYKSSIIVFGYFDIEFNVRFFKYVLYLLVFVVVLIFFFNGGLFFVKENIYIRKNSILYGK